MNPNVSDIRSPGFVNGAQLTILQEIRIDGQTVTRIGRVHKRAPGDWPQPELLHDATNALLVDSDATTLQLTRDTTISIAWKFLMNALDLSSQLLVFIVTML